MDHLPETLGALHGIRVLDLSRVLAGPWCTQMLGDLGAEVIKVERPDSGDDTRAWGPPFDARSGDAAYFQCANRNKRSLAVDFSRSEGADLIRELVARCDVVVENFKPGGLEKYGLAPAQLRAAHPTLVVCSITGFGHTGPLRERAGYDFVVQALGGLMSVTGPPADAPASAPYKVGVAVADLFTGLHAVVAILAALRHRDSTGQGQHVDLALFDCQLSMLANVASQWLRGGPEPRRLGNAHPSIAPYEALPCADGDLVIAVGNDGQFSRLCSVLGLPSLPEDPRFVRNADRLQHRQALRSELSAVLQRHDRGHWQKQLDAVGVPASAVHTVVEALAHPQTSARGMLEPMDHDQPERGTLVASPLKLSASPVQHRRPPPELGQHSRQVLADLGLPSERIEALIAAGVVCQLPQAQG